MKKLGLAVLGLVLAVPACMTVEDDKEPQPSRARSYYLHHEESWDIKVLEFRDDWGRVCIFIPFNGRPSLDCDYPREVTP